MDKITKVALLGVNSQLLKDLCDRVNETRPAEIRYFTSLKDFLESCIEDPPDLVGVSVTFPHKSAPKFPKVFRMALNVPILIFGESQNLKARKLLNSMDGDLKIQGKITAHNLWMKIVNFHKIREEEMQRQSGAEGVFSSVSGSDSVFLKNKGNSNINVESKGSLLSSLFAALDDNSSSARGPNLSLVKSTGTTKFRNQPIAHVSALQPDTPDEGEGSSIQYSGSGLNLPEDNDLDRAANEVFGGSQRDQALGSSNKSSNMSFLKGETPFDTDTGTDEERDMQNHIDRAMEDMFSNLNPESSDNPERKGDFGKVRLADESEIKKEDIKKAKDLNEKELQKKKNILIEACEFGAREVYAASGAGQNVETFDVKNLKVFILESVSYKGYLVLALSSENYDENVEAFRQTVIVSLQQKGFTCSLAKDIPVEVGVKQFPETINEFAEFSLNFKKTDSLITISFVKREVVRPLFVDSEKENMYNVDIKVIPPKTLVNFDAYIFLPRNNRFVRYLKAGRSLSLKQAKRFMEEMEKGKLYLPKDQKEQFISFFIQNTLNWEFTLHKKKNVS